MQALALSILGSKIGDWLWNPPRLWLLHREYSSSENRNERHYGWTRHRQRGALSPNLIPLSSNRILSEL